MTTLTAAPIFTSHTAQYITQCMLRTLAYAEQLTADIPPEKFAVSPHRNMNHPAFCIGHLSLYPDRVFTLLGMPKLVAEQPGYSELFKAGVACVSDPARYPAKAELLEHYTERYRKTAEILPSVGEEVFQRPNPLEGRMREIFPLVGTAVNFLLNNHQMVHLGQISAWRRAIGMGPAA